MDKSGGAPPGGLDWSFLQCFGERTPGEEVQEADVISAVEFDSDGSFLATGDKGGRVVLFERVPMQQRYVGMDQRAPPLPRGPGFEYRYLTEFQSHEPEFDYLKSLEIEEKINKVRWVRSSSGAKHIISTNDKTIKLWKVYEKRVAHVTGFNVERSGGGFGALGAAAASPRTAPAARLAGPLRLPTVAGSEVVLASRTKRVFANAHTYHINSISVSSDQETFLSADDLRVNLWNLEVADQSFNIVDIKPTNMEDLTEVITSAEFHPQHCNVFAYSSSKGCIRLADMRGAALCDRHAKAYEEADAHGGAKSFFSEIIASISDIRFSRDGRYLLSRDYMTVKLWDLAKENAPVATFSVHEGLRQRLCDLYENDCIFDKFDCCMNGTATAVASGSYSNSFRVFGAADGGDATLEATRDPMRKRMQTPPAKGNRFAIRAKNMAGLGKRSPGDGPEIGSDFSSKLLHLAWHPEANVIACAASNSLYMYCA
ncbi:serine threonine phosphatase 2A 55 kDa regulatory subunit B [Raphidocelis subcapitata]|uniref:Serine/threonine-protein phosphatase 2A 55 kDa regulatory subunit B n=1 Tax=Raphidocelis subcapitata TaxID=307507 RepID=A0A2V0P9Y8_9CHLO|nr:serine threonine phosphatase 2A 55 kDa regulatory subunit B [Raphidocelis subcapitata]|eukprot:GBF96678.1 serine threonine phosphatase 2A 55 kDa regulatory subunit B [Raphidocelis subcapitata]